MSEGSTSQRNWLLYIHDMINFAKKALAYTQGMEQQHFETNSLIYDATLRNLELIGEAATHVPDNIREKYSTIPWRMIIASRNRLIHAYLGIDNDTVWSIIKEDIPELIEALEEIVADFES